MLVERLEHYFSTYKMVPGEPNKMEISGKYGFEHAKAVIEAASADYEEKFGEATQERRRLNGHRSCNGVCACRA